MITTVWRSYITRRRARLTALMIAMAVAAAGCGDSRHDTSSPTMSFGSVESEMHSSMADRSSKFCCAWRHHRASGRGIVVRLFLEAADIYRGAGRSAEAGGAPKLRSRNTAHLGAGRRPGSVSGEGTPPVLSRVWVGSIGSARSRAGPETPMPRQRVVQVLWRWSGDQTVDVNGDLICAGARGDNSPPCAEI